MSALKKKFDEFILSLPKGATFSIIGGIALYAGAKGWIGEAEMTLIAIVLSSLGYGTNQYVKSLYTGKDGEK